MEEKYQSIDALNKAWNTDFVSFADLYRPQKEISKRSDAAKEDMRRLEQLRGQTLHTRQRKTKKARQFIIRWII